MNCPTQVPDYILGIWQLMWIVLTAAVCLRALYDKLRGY